MDGTSLRRRPDKRGHPLEWARVVCITRLGEAVMPTAAAAVQEDDLVPTTVRTGTEADVAGTLSKPPEGSD